MHETGRYETITEAGAPARAFVPPPLTPPPALDVRPLQRLLDEANRAVGRLDGVTTVLPSTPLFLYMYVRKEALLSSQIEGTQSSLSDLLLFEDDEAPGAPIDDVEEVSNYVAAMTHGLARLEEGLPLCARLLREIHAILLRGGRGAAKTPGEYRRSLVWIGGAQPSTAIFVPPAHTRVPDLIQDLETFLNDEASDLSALVRAAIAHVQFETIHPFLDGNGRLGRLLITLMLCEQRILRQPVLYLSLYFKTNRRAYYELLQRVRDEGDWRRWIEFFLIGVRDTANRAAETAHRILQLFEDDRRDLESLDRAAGSALRLQELMQHHPIVSVPRAADALSLTQPTIRTAMDHLQAQGLVAEISGRRRGRLYRYSKYLEILSEGTEPIDP